MFSRTIQGIDELRSLVGQELGTSDYLELSQAMIDAFAEVTGDRQWIHLDQQRAKAESPYGTTVAHGFLTLALVSHLHSQVAKIEGDFTRAINYGLNRVRFPAAVPSGARIRAHSMLEALEEVAGGVQLTGLSPWRLKASRNLPWLPSG